MEGEKGKTETTEITTRQRLAWGLCCALLLTCNLGGAEPLYLVKDGKAEATIVRPRGKPPARPAKTDKEGNPTPDYEAKYAKYRQESYRHYSNIALPARRMQDYVQKITGARLTVVEDGTPAAKAARGPTVHMGLTDYVKGLDLPLESPFGQVIVLKRLDDKLVIAGGPERGVLNAVTSFLEEECGVRRYIPGPLGWVIPEKKTIAIDKLDRRDEPDYASRDFSGIGEGQAVPGGYAWSTWNDAKQGPLHIFHNIGNVIHPAKYGAGHPEYFPLIGGERRVPPKWRWKKPCKNWQPCWSNPQVLEIATEEARKFFDERPGSMLFNLAQNDNYGYCMCAKCLKMNGGLKYDEHGHVCFSNLIYGFYNKVAEQLVKTHPGKLIGGYAYQCGTYDPPEFPIHPNVVVCRTLDLSPYHFDPEYREKMTAYMKKWSAVGKKFTFHVWHNGMGFLFPRLELRSTKTFLKFGYEIGAIGYHGEEYANFGLEGPKSWISSRLLWDTDADVDALLQEFCENFYGKAAEPMRRYYDTLENAWNAQPPQNPPLNYIFRPQMNRVITPGVVHDCRRALAEALAKAEDETVRKRIELARKAFRVTEYYSARFMIWDSIRDNTPQTSKAFAELVSNLNRMQYGVQALENYLAQIEGDTVMFCAGKMAVRNLTGEYCAVGSSIATALARLEVAEKKPDSQAALSVALKARFGALSKLVAQAAKAEPLSQGLAWPKLRDRLDDYLTATAYVPRLKVPPTLDGKLGEDTWKDAAVLTGFNVMHDRSRKITRNPATNQTAVRIGFDGKALYLGASCKQDLAKLVQNREKRDSGVWRDDSLDFTLLSADAPKEEFRHYIVNPRGTLYDALGKGEGSGDWQGEIQIKTGKDEKTGTWILEMAIPWRDFGRAPESGTVWRAQFGRIQPLAGKEELSCWAPSPEGFNNADYLGVLLFE